MSPCAAAPPLWEQFSTLSPPTVFSFFKMLHTSGIPAGCGEQHESISNPSALHQHKGQNKHTFV